jgi:hypothetical protein
MKTRIIVWFLVPGSWFGCKGVLNPMLTLKTSVDYLSLTVQANLWPLVSRVSNPQACFGDKFS